MRASHLALAAALCASGCAGSSKKLPLRPASAGPDDTKTALLAAAEAFYAAQSPEGLRSAVAQAKAVDPDSALFHEIAGYLALFEHNNDSAEIQHSIEALRDPTNDAPHATIHRLFAKDPALSERWSIAAVLRSLAAEHPDPTVQARARRRLSQTLWRLGDWEGARAAEAAIRTGLDWRIIGAWDNDQGKGFDEVLPPEKELNLEARYDGALLEIGWRKPAIDVVGAELDLGAVTSPARWVIGYATTAFEVSQAGPLELRLASSVPFKVWLDGKLVFSARVVTRGTFDQVVLPVDFEAGRHRLLVKSAQDTGGWSLGVRVTEPGGGPTDRVRALAPDAAPTGGGAVKGPQTLSDAFAERAQALRARMSPLRAHAHVLRLAERMGLRAESLAESEAFMKAAPRSIYARYSRASMAWDHGERGKTSDLLESLAKEYGDELVFLHLQHARFLRQEGLQRKARGVLTQARAVAPPEAQGALELRWARQFSKQGWTEDRCRALEKALAARPGWEQVMRDLGDCYEDLRFHEDARRIYRELAVALPGHNKAIQRLFTHARDDERFDDAERYGRALIQASPIGAWTHRRLAEVYRRQRRIDDAMAELDRAKKLDPDASATWKDLAHLLYQVGRTEEAVEAWRESLVRNPDDDAVAHRLAWLAPEDEGIWARDIPDESRIKEALARRDQEVAPGAHTLVLLDHEVTLVKPDGSTSDVITFILQALDDTGRDQLTKVDLRRGGRMRLLRAYAIAPDGQRTQVSNVRSRVARFRNLSVGSTVVIQYRHDAKPVGYLSRHVARSWWFQQTAAQSALSEWVLWMPQGTKLHEWLKDPARRVTRTEENRDGLTRVSWTSRDLEPLIGEPSMPTRREVAVNLLVSTVPDWATFLEWEKALLTDAFREDSTIAELAERIVGEAKSPREKAMRIHKWLMEEIRYQQDYENHIAGVRPHAATVVVERSYGDCKDKSVLFITLARKVGLEAQFVLLRTRPKGPVLRDIPMQQFDHAIVYVPAQEGLEQGFFVDSTADALDLSALRHDDMGVQALVLDADAESHTWREIPFRPPNENSQDIVARLELDPSGSGTGSVDIRARGATGSNLRRLARNARRLEQGLQRFASGVYGGAVARDVTAVETEDLTQPAHLRMGLEVPNLGRREGQEVRIRLPPAWNPKAVFQLETRRYPLVMGVPRSLAWTTELELPSSLRVRRKIPDEVVDAPCFRFERRTTVSGRTVRIQQTFASTCERISVKDYDEHRRFGQEVTRAQEQELVLVGRSRS